MNRIILFEKHAKINGNHSAMSSGFEIEVELTSKVCKKIKTWNVLLLTFSLNSYYNVPHNFVFEPMEFLLSLKD